MIRITHPNGQQRIINLNAIESIYADAAGLAIVKMGSGVEYTLRESYDSFVGAVEKTLKRDVTQVEGEMPQHPETAQKGPLPPPVGDQSPVVPKRGIPYGTKEYNPKEPPTPEDSTRAKERDADE